MPQRVSSILSTLSIYAWFSAIVHFITFLSTLVRSSLTGRTANPRISVTPPPNTTNTKDCTDQENEQQEHPQESLGTLHLQPIDISSRHSGRSSDDISQDDVDLGDKVYMEMDVASRTSDRSSIHQIDRVDQFSTPRNSSFWTISSQATLIRSLNNTLTSSPTTSNVPSDPNHNAHSIRSNLTRGFRSCVEKVRRPFLRQRRPRRSLPSTRAALLKILIGFVAVALIFCVIAVLFVHYHKNHTNELATQETSSVSPSSNTTWIQ